MRLYFLYFLMCFGFLVCLSPLATFGLVKTYHSGSLFKSSGSFYLKTQDQDILLSPQSPSAIFDLQQLESGDQVTVEAFESNDKQLHVFSIEQVGLKRLIGSWQTSPDSSGAFKTYTFGDLKHLTVDADPFLTKERAYELFEYRVTPGFGMYWRIHIFGKYERFLGHLFLHDNQLVLRFEDPLSGKTIHRVQLQRLNAK